MSSYATFKQALYEADFTKAEAVVLDEMGVK